LSEEKPNNFLFMTFLIFYTFFLLVYYRGMD